MSNAVHGRNTAIWVNEFDLSNYLKKFAVNRDAPELECTTFQDTARSYVADFSDGSLSLEGFFSHDETDQDTAEDVFKAALSTAAEVVTVAPEGGATFGLRAMLQDAVETKHMIDSPATGLIMSNADFRGGVSHGVLLAQKASRTATGNGTSVDGAVATTSGGVAHLHVFAKSGTSPTLDVKVQHSTDNSVFVDLITMTQATVATSERKTVTGTVNRYVRETHTLGGTSPNFTFAVAFARLY